MGGRPSGTVAFLFTDVEGSTRLWAADAAAMSASLLVHDAILREAIEAGGGYVFTTAADSFAAAFSKASDAVSAAEQIQARLADAAWPSPALRVRIGVHLGEAEERGGDYFGPVVNTTARVEAAGHGGQTLITDTVRVAARAEATDLGVHRLRDVDEPLHLFQIGDGVFPSAALPISRFGRAGRLVSGALSIDASEEEPHYWGDIELGMWALDIWIGSPDDRGRGLGADAVKLALGRVFDQHGAEMVVIDPAVDNHRAIAFYEQHGSNAPGFASSATMSAW